MKILQSVTHLRPFTFLIFYSLFLISLSSCSVSTKISKSARTTVLNAAPLKTAHIGISIYDPETGKYLYNYQGDKYFVPASNTKIPTCYAAMKYLGDSLVGLRYGYSYPDSTTIGIQPTGDPTLMHSDFNQQAVMEFLKRWVKAKGENSIALLDTVWKDERWGNGWSWNDYDAAYMAERSSLPIFGNVININLLPLKDRVADSTNGHEAYKVFRTQSSVFDKMLHRQLPFYKNVVFENNETIFTENPHWRIERKIGENFFEIKSTKEKFSNTELPFVTKGSMTAYEVLGDTLKLKDYFSLRKINDTSFTLYCPDCRIVSVKIKQWNKIHSQPTDSLLKPMMHRSDNFFADQSLLMVSNERLGYMNDSKIIDTLLKTDFKDLPQKPRWADGSGLSRYNLFTPQDFVAILNKMKNEFGMERIKTIFPTGGEGTISSYYKAGNGYVYAKTGTLSGVVALSGFLYTKKGKLLIFSTLVNNHQATSTEVRRAVEKFVESLREF
ncbi:MAG TPA: D-alanyl-D-alanine carboxypeptidase [Chitinophagaceae bacterium]|nr:D-alanyl-D-alanine carboxypeptidase [Chitinophagaceae bacterium]